MSHAAFDRRRLEFLPLKARQSKFEIDAIAIDPDAAPPEAGAAGGAIERTAERIIAARGRGAPVAICFGAHLVKNGLAPLIIRMVEEGWLQHVATNGAGSIHDWEFAFMGRSCEDVRAYVERGQFGIWDETGGHIGLSLLLGGLDGLGYGQSVGRLIVEQKLDVPAREELETRLRPGPGVAAVAEVLEAVDLLAIEPGERSIPHTHAHRSFQAACYRRDVPCTVHPGIGQDIIYTHPLFVGGAVGRASVTDFLIYAETIRNLSGGVYLSVGSSVMSPMIFEKSVSMARNLARGSAGLNDFHIVVVDLAESTWDWSRGEPPVDDPAYYVRFCKSFSRMGGTMEYIGVDNRVFLSNLYARLNA